MLQVEPQNSRTRHDGYLNLKPLAHSSPKLFYWWPLQSGCTNSKVAPVLGFMPMRAFEDRELLYWLPMNLSAQADSRLIGRTFQMLRFLTNRLLLGESKPVKMTLRPLEVLFVTVVMVEVIIGSSAKAQSHDFSTVGVRDNPVATAGSTPGSMVAKIEVIATGEESGYSLTLRDGSTLKLLRGPEAKIEFQRLIPVEREFVNALGAGAFVSAASYIEDQYVANRETERSLEQDPRVKRARRVGQFIVAMRDAIFVSTFSAAKQFWQHSREHRQERVTEFGFEFAFRLDIQGGASKTAINQNIPMMFKISFDRAQRDVVFRWGRRFENLSEGGVVNAGIRLETKAFLIRGSDRRASKRGSGWYPPSIPWLAPVVDFGHGYSAIGLVFSALNLSDYLVWTAFLNTVNEFNERQASYRISFARLKKLETWLNWGERAWDRSLDGLEAAAISIEKASRVQPIRNELTVAELQDYWQQDRVRGIVELDRATRTCENLFMSSPASLIH